MKYLFAICFFLIVSCNHSGPKTSNTGLKSAVTENVAPVAVVLTIQGMTCTGCEQTVQSGISSIEGIKQVKATFKDGKAYVEYIPGIADTSQMKEKITASGYIVTNIHSISLDSLRKKL